MNIDDTLRKLFISPTLNGTLSTPVDDFQLETVNGPVQLAATLRIDTNNDNGFILDVRDSEGRNLSDFFTAKKNVSPEDTLSASGVIGNKFRVEFLKIWPPCSSTTRLIGDVQASSAKLEPEEIRIIPQTDDTWTYDEITDRLNELNADKAPIQTKKTSVKVGRFEHVAIFANTKIQFFNGGVKWEQNHPFWGKVGGSKDATWDGTALGGTFSLKQADKHLEVGFRHDGDDDDEARLKFDSLIQAVAYTHAIFPWPTFIQRRRDHQMMERTLKVVCQEQGRMVPLRDRDGFESKNSPTDLITSVAKHFEELPESGRDELKQVMWVFRGADSRIAPAPLQMAMICSVIEGLRTELFTKVEPPAFFKEIRKEALGWIKSREISATTPEKLAMIKRLHGWVNGWPPNDRRVEWNQVFLDLFPGRDAWLVELCKLFGAHRHGPAHGNYNSSTKGDVHSIIDALGRLAGFVNLIIAAKAGYKGRILESPFADRRLEL